MGFNTKKGGKKTMFATWSDSDSFESESDGDEMTNLFLMAR